MKGISKPGAGRHRGSIVVASRALAALTSVCLAAPARAEDAAPAAAAPGVADPFRDPFRPRPPRPRGAPFAVDPVLDGVLIAGSTTFALLLSQIAGTGEIGPLAVGSSDRLLSIDKVAVTQTIDPDARARSNVGIYAAVGYAILDPIVSGVREGRRAFLVDIVMYAEAIALTQAFVQIAKAGVRRPRPIDHIMCSGEAASRSSDCSNPDLQLSFFSGHTATMGTVTGVATYLAFVRSDSLRSGSSSPRPWITLAVGTAATAFVGYERVRSGEHFPTDVITGALVGGAIGVLVAHLHRHPHLDEEEAGAPLVMIGYAPAPHGGGALNLQVRF